MARILRLIAFGRASTGFLEKIFLLQFPEKPDQFNYDMRAFDILNNPQYLVEPFQVQSVNRSSSLSIGLLSKITQLPLESNLDLTVKIPSIPTALSNQIT